MTYAYDRTGCSGSTSTTSRAARSCSFDAPSRSAPTTTNTHPSPRPLQFLYDSRLRTREYEYLAFGGTYSPTTTVSLPQRYTYTGRELNPTSDLMYYRYRTYDPRVGQFGARDPIGYRGGASIYGYVGARASTSRDAFGLCEVEATGTPEWETDKALPDAHGTEGVTEGVPTAWVAYAECEMKKETCPGVCKRARPKRIALAFALKVLLMPDANYFLIRHELHHVLQYERDVEDALQPLCSYKGDCVYPHKFKKAREACEQALRESAESIKDQISQAWQNDTRPDASNPYEYDDVPGESNHPIGGAYNHQTDPWSEGYPMP